MTKSEEKVLPKSEKKLYCLQGGLMEDPNWRWEYIGEAEGETLMEVADNYALKNLEFAEYYNPTARIMSSIIHEARNNTMQDRLTQKHIIRRN